MALRATTEGDAVGGRARIVRPLEDVHCHYGDRVKLILGVECHPPAEVTWTFQGRPITLNGDHIFDHVGNSYILELPRVTADHAGTYGAEIRDSTGTHQTKCHLTMERPPEDMLVLALGPEAKDIPTPRHVTSSFVSTKKTMLMQTTSSSKSEITAGGRVLASEEHQATATEKHGYEKLGDAPPSVYRSRERFGFDRVGDGPPQPFHEREVLDDRLQAPDGVTPQLAIEGPAAEGIAPSVMSAGQLASEATNVTTRITKAKPLSILQRSGSAHLPPKFTRPIQSVAVLPGDKIVLEGWFTGHPEPIVKWSRGSTTLSHKFDLQIAVEKGYTSLIIPRATRKDHARYTCVISNDVGSSSSAADVVVQEKQEAPEFVKRLEARVCKPATKVVLEVKVTGIPAPDVTWLRNGVNLNALNTYEIQKRGNLHTLTIQKSQESDSGRITVLAKNPAGEAQSIADLLIEEEGSSEEEREVTIRDYRVEDEKKMEVTMVQAEHVHRKRTLMIERPSQPKEIPALPEPPPASPIPTITHPDDKPATQSPPLKRRPPPEESPEPVDSVRITKKQLETTEIVERRQEHTLHHDLVETVRIAPTFQLPKDICLLPPAEKPKTPEPKEKPRTLERPEKSKSPKPLIEKLKSPEPMQKPNAPEPIEAPKALKPVRKSRTPEAVLKPQISQHTEMPLAPELTKKPEFLLSTKPSELPQPVEKLKTPEPVQEPIPHQPAVLPEPPPQPLELPKPPIVPLFPQQPAKKTKSPEPDAKLVEGFHETETRHQTTFQHIHKEQHVVWRRQTTAEHVRAQAERDLRTTNITAEPATLPLSLPPPPPPPPTLTPLPEQPPVATKVMIERKIEQTARIVRRQERIDHVISATTDVFVPQQQPLEVAPSLPLSPLPPPLPPPDLPVAPIPMLPAVRATLRQPPQRHTPELVPASPVPAPLPPLPEPLPPPPSLQASVPPPPPPLAPPARVASKRRAITPPPPPLPPPRFRDERLTFEQIRHQEVERLRRQCKRITVTEQVSPPPLPFLPQPPPLPLLRIGAPPLTLLRRAAPSPAPAPTRLDCRWITETLTRPLAPASPPPQNLEEALREFYRLHREQVNSTIVKQVTSVPLSEPVCHVQEVDIRRPVTYPTVHEKNWVDVLNLKSGVKVTRPLSPPGAVCRVRQVDTLDVNAARIDQVRNVRSAEPVCHVQEVNARRPVVHSTVKDQNWIDVLDLKSTVKHSRPLSPPRVLCSVRRADVLSVREPSAGQAIKIHASEPACRVQEIDVHHPYIYPVAGDQNWIDILDLKSTVKHVKVQSPPPPEALCSVRRADVQRAQDSSFDQGTALLDVRQREPCSMSPTPLSQLCRVHEMEHAVISRHRTDTTVHVSVVANRSGRQWWPAAGGSEDIRNLRVKRLERSATYSGQGLPLVRLDEQFRRAPKRTPSEPPSLALCHIEPAAGGGPLPALPPALAADARSSAVRVNVVAVPKRVWSEPPSRYTRHAYTGETHFVGVRRRAVAKVKPPPLPPQPRQLPPPIETMPSTVHMTMRPTPSPPPAALMTAPAGRVERPLQVASSLTGRGVISRFDESASKESAEQTTTLLDVRQRPRTAALPLQKSSSTPLFHVQEVDHKPPQVSGGHGAAVDGLIAVKTASQGAMQAASPQLAASLGRAEKLDTQEVTTSAEAVSVCSAISSVTISHPLPPLPPPRPPPPLPPPPPPRPPLRKAKAKPTKKVSPPKPSLASDKKAQHTHFNGAAFTHSPCAPTVSVCNLEKFHQKSGTAIQEKDTLTATLDVVEKRQSPDRLLAVQAPLALNRFLKVSDGKMFTSRSLGVSPTSAQRLIRTSEWVRQARGADRNVLLTERFRRCDDSKDQVNLNLVSQRCWSVPPEPSSLTPTSFYIDHHKRSILGELIEPKKQARAPWFMQPLVDRLQQQGDRITLVCIVVAHPQPSINWYKDNMLLTCSNKHDISFDRGTARLIILHAVPQDSGRYVCTASNSAGSAITSCRIHVAASKDRGMVVSPPRNASSQEVEWRGGGVCGRTMATAPIWVRQPIGGRFIEGRDARFDATVRGDPMPQLVWSRRGLPIRNDHKRETGYNPVTGDTYLLIRDITPDDDGEYTCTAVNPSGEAVLVVSVVRDLTAAQQMIEQRHTITEEHVIGQPVMTPLQQQLVRSSSTVFGDTLQQFYHNGSSHAFRVDTFEYRLLREDEFRESLMKITLDEIMDSTDYREVIHKSRPLAPPQIIGRPRNSKLLAGSDATFQVRVPANPDPRITWFRNGQRIKNSSRHVALYEDGVASLTIRNCQADDAGYYTMLAENSKGRVATSMHLVIEDSSYSHVLLTRPPWLIEQSENYVMEAEKLHALRPSFVRPPVDREVSEGHQVRFECLVTGRPTPEVLWFRSGVQVCDDNAHKLLVNEGGVHALQINDAQLTDAGQWTCVVRNKSGEVRQDVNLIVVERELVVPPKFVERFQNTSVQEGEPVSLHCRAVGTPMPQLLWLKDGVQIHSAPPHILVEAGNDGSSSLHIDSAILSDGAWYQCTATNQAGSTATRARLHVDMLPRQLTMPWSLNLPPATTIIEPERPPPPETVVLKHWEKPHVPPQIADDLPSVPQKPAFTSHLLDVVVNEGDRAHFEARLVPIGDPTLNVEWFVNGKILDASSRVMTVNRFGYVALTMLNAYPEDEGVFLCRARNQAGEATVSASLKVLPKPAVDATSFHRDHITTEQLEQYQKIHRQGSMEDGVLHQKPSFIKPLENLENHTEGGFARFEAQIQPVNDPTMRVEWFFNGRPLTSSSRINSTFSFGYVALNISSLRYEDSGVYMVKATNANGDALSTATLKVESLATVTAYSGFEEQQKFIQETDLMESYRGSQQARHEWKQPEEPSEAPAFVTQPRDQQNVQEGKTVLFEARLEPSGDSSMRVEWLKDGKPLEASSRTQCMFSFGYVSLRIAQVEERDSGTYTVVATNKMGKATATANLTCASVKETVDISSKQTRLGLERIQHLEDYSRYDRKQHEEVYAVTKRPQFLDQLKGDEQFVEGQSAHFESRLEPMGDPSMSVEWYHNGKPLTTGHRFKTYFDFGYVALDVLTMHVEDSGTLTVVARNSIGEASLSKQVVVLAETGVDTTSITDVTTVDRIVTKKSTTTVEEFESVSQTKPYFTIPLKNIHRPFTEGDKVTLECKLEPANDPSLTTEWLHNGRALITGSRITTKSDFGHIVLQIDGVTEQDSGQYTVRATNHLGTTVTSSTIKIIGKSGVDSQSQYPEGLEKIHQLESRRQRREEEVLQVFGRPEFRKPLHNIETREGLNIHLECRLEPAQDPSLRVEWFKNNAPVTVGHRFRPAHEFDYVALDILSAYPEDSGVYTCRAVNRQGESTTSSSVTVTAISQTVVDKTDYPEAMRQIEALEHKQSRLSYHEELLKIKPQFTSEPKSLSLIEGQSAHFECRLEPVNDPDLKVEWYKDGRPLPIGHRFRPFHDFGYVALNILSVTSADAGTYSCQATNKLGSAEVVTTLAATDSSSIITTTENPESVAKIAQLEGHKFVRYDAPDQTITTGPVFTSAPQNISVVEGARSHFECRLIPVGDPQLKVEWLHNGEPIKQGSRFVELFNFGFVALDIMTTYAEDSGAYTCRATNALGEAVVTATLSCAPVGSLILESQQPESLAQIRHLEGHSRYQRKVYTDELQTQAPVFSNPMRNVTIHENGQAHFECRLTPLGDPKMSVEWLKNGMPLAQSSRISTINDFGFIALDLKGAKVGDTGTYTCRAVNEIGEAICSAQLIVEGESSLILTPQQPDSLQAIQQLELGRPRAAAKEEPQCKSPPRFVTQLTGPCNVTEGQSAHYECRVEPFPDSTMTYEWLHNGKLLDQGHRFRTVTDFGFVALDILSARPYDSGEYIVRARNQLGEATSKITLTVRATGSLILESQQPESLDAIRRLEGTMGYQRAEFLEKAVTERPQFVRGLNNLDNLKEGGSAHIEATLTPANDPDLKVEWLHNGVPVAAGARYRVICDFGYVALDISDVQSRDSGVFMCKATNNFGEAVTSCQIRVVSKASIITESNISEDGLHKLRSLEQHVVQKRDEKPLPQIKPVFIQPLRSVDNLTEGQPIHLECRLEPVHDPKLKVEWFVNGVEVKQGSRFRTTNDFGYVALDILYCYGEDSGTYMCKASNEVGEAVTTCSVTAKNRRSLILETQHPRSVQRINELESAEKFRRVEVEEKAISKPIFITELHGTYELVEGQTAHMECRVEPAHDSNLKIDMLHNGKHIEAANRIRITTDFGYVALDIANVYPEDSGTYTIRATNTLGVTETSMNVVVAEKSSIQSESFHPESMQTIREIEQKSYKANDYSATPVFQRPEFTQSLKNCEISENHQCHLEARLIPVGDPSLKIEWLVNDKPICEGSRIHTVQDFGFVSIMIDYVRPEDNGVYTCRALNSQGQASTSCSVKVLPKEAIQLHAQQPQSLQAIQELEASKVTLTKEMPEVMFEKPVFTQPLTGPKEANENCSVRFECRCTPLGDPHLKFVWLCNGKNIENANRMTFGKDFGYITLDIHSVRAEDSGVYMCKALNHAGEAVTSTSFKVKSKALVQEDSLHPEAYRIMQQYEYDLAHRKTEECPELAMGRPVFIKQLESIKDVSEGQYIRLEGRVEPAKDSKMKIEWFKNQQPLGLGSRLKATHDFGLVSLDLSGVRAEDSGIYVCRATNESGEAVSTCTVKIEPSASLLLGSLQPESLERIKEMESYQMPASKVSVEPVFEMPVFTSHMNDLELMEGDTAHFKCHVEPAKDPTLRVEFLRNQEPLTSGSRITTRNDFGVVTVDIQGVSSNDAGIYSIKVVNSKGQATSTASLKVTDKAAVQLDTLHPTGEEGLSSIKRVEDMWSTKYLKTKAQTEKIFPKPMFTQPLSSKMIVEEGKGVTLECRVEPSTDPLLKVEVFFNGKLLADANRFRWTNEFGYINLTIRDFWARDSGVYTIRAANRAGEAFTTTTIECKSTKTILESTVHPEGAKGLESIQALEESRVKSQIEADSSDDKGHAPVFTSQFANLTDMVEGDVAHFEAMLSPPGDQTMSVEWLFNGRPIEMGHRIRTVHAFGIVLMEILGVIIEDSGTYTCRAKNAFGETEITVELKCVDKQKGQRPKFISQLSDVTGLREGEAVHLECNITPVGDPDLHVEWFKNGKPLPDSSRIKTLSDFGFVVIDISYVHHEDSGEYVCVATNKYGSDTTRCVIDCASSGKLFLETLQPRSMEQITRMEGMRCRTVTKVDSSILQAPKFSSHIQNVVGLIEGQSAHFECQLIPINDPELRVEWYFNGQMMRSGHRFRTFHDFGVVVLDILYCYAEDSGEWVCKATNKYGTDVTRATLTCKSKSTLILESQLPAEMAGGHEKLNRFERRLTRSATATSMQSVEEAPSFTQLLNDFPALREGENMHLEARLTPTNDPDLTVEWFKDGAALRSGARVRTISDFGFVVLELSPVYPEDSGVYTCKARNRFGEALTSCTVRCESKRSIISESQLPTNMQSGIDKLVQLEHRIGQTGQHADGRGVDVEHASGGPPQFVSSPSDLALNENGLAHFECRVQPANDPNLRIDWFHNGKPLTTGSRVKSISDFGFVILEIAGVYGRDAGVYTCRAVNREGEASVSCQLSIKTRQSVVVDSQLPQGFSTVGIKSLEESRYHKTASRRSSDQEKHEAPKFVTQLTDTYERTEGDNAHFECKLVPVGDPSMKVEWFVNGAPLITGSRVHTVDDFGFVVLEIDWLFPRDSGEYMCRATNKWGSDVTRCTLTVKPKANIILDSQLPAGIDLGKLRELEVPPAHQVSPKDAPLSPPRFVTQIQHQHGLKEGDSAHFECRLEPTTDPRLCVEWFHNGQPLISGHRYKTTHDFGFVALDILYCYAEDSGEYVARAVSDLGEDLTKATLECTGKPRLDYRTQLPMKMKDGVRKIAEMESIKHRTESVVEQTPERFAPTIVQKPEAQVVQEGEWTKFQCRVIGNPKPRVIWVLNGNTVVSGSRYKLTFDGIYHFDIPKTRQYDAGKVEVFARNAEGEAYCFTTLEVRQHQSDYRAVLKQSPNPWYDRDMRSYQVDRQRKEEKRVFEEVLPGGQNVDVWKTEKTDQGKKQVKQHLTTEELDRIHESEAASVMSSKAISEKMSSTVQQLSSQQKLMQQQQHQLRQAILHRQQQEQLRKSEVVSTTVQGRELTQSIQEQTQKVYKGESEIHKRKQVTESFEQSHKGTASERMVEDPIQPACAPQFSKKIQPCRVTEGETASFECEFTGDPAPSITWYRENFTIKNSKDFEIKTSETKSILIIREVYLEDSGVFSVKAENRGGSAKSSANLIVEEKQEEAGLAPPNFTKTIQSQRVKQGMNVRMMCCVSGGRPLDVYWMRGGQKVAEDDRHRINESGDQCTLVIIGAKSDDSANYECVALNKAGEARCMAQIVVEPTQTSTPNLQQHQQQYSLPDSSVSAPQVTEKIRDATVKQGQAVTFRCRIPASPTAQVKWYRGESLIKQSRYYKISGENHVYTLRITEAFPEDEGEYRCEAINKVGAVSTKALLKVLVSEEGESPPTLGLLNDLTVNENEPATFSTSLSGTPRPKVSWYKGGQLIRATRDFQVLQDDSSCTLQIRNVLLTDEGNYTCRVTNVAGQAEASARLTVQRKARQE